MQYIYVAFKPLTEDDFKNYSFQLPNEDLSSEIHFWLRLVTASVVVHEVHHSKLDKSV
jgi:hypothetical protein